MQDLPNLKKELQVLKKMLQDVSQVALLLQDDPDPDGLAAALALRKILGRNAQTASIVSFGKISRPENVAMARLLDVQVELIDEESLQQFEKVIMIDCQPSFFAGRQVHADFVVDHHPKKENALKEVEYSIIHKEFGALSSLMTYFLKFENIEPSQRLATALLYGIKADTLMLNRQVSDEDLEAFLYLYPRIHFNTLRKIERPEIPKTYFETLRKALKYISLENSFVFLPLGIVEKEEWIPQSADFALQMENSKWSIAYGIFEKDLVISGRNCGFVGHCGELFKKAFDSIGCAGGHKSMAKAKIPMKVLKQKYGERVVKTEDLLDLVQEILFEANYDTLGSYEYTL